MGRVVHLLSEQLEVTLPSLFRQIGVSFETGSMKLAIILSTNNAEKNWNALRLGNLALKSGDNVSVFLIGEGVEYLKFSDEKFDIQKQVGAFLESGKGEILACETCMVLRHQKDSKTCPVSGMKELYNLIKESDKVITF